MSISEVQICSLFILRCKTSNIHQPIRRSYNRNSFIMRNHTRNSSGSQAEGCSPRHSMMLSIPKFFILGILVASSSAFTTIDTTSRTCTSHRSTSLFYRDSSDVHEPSTSIKKKTASDFTQRMKSIVQKRPVPRLENMKTATSLEEYANVIEEARESKRMVVVKFHAVWCKVRMKEIQSRLYGHHCIIVSNLQFHPFQ